MVLDYSSGAKPKYQCPFFYYKFIYCNWKLITLQYCIGFVVFVLSWSAHIFLTVFILHRSYNEGSKGYHKNSCTCLVYYKRTFLEIFSET